MEKRNCWACGGSGYRVNRYHSLTPCDQCSGFGFIPEDHPKSVEYTYDDINIDLDKQDLKPKEEGMDKIYIAGPMTGYEGYNFDAFNRAERQIEDFTDFKPVNPAGEDDLDDDGNPTQTKEEFIRRDLRKLTKCDAICLLDNWKCSSGAQSEVRAALEMGLDFYTLEPVNELKPLENPETIMREAEGAITGTKMDAYGQPGEALDKIAGIWNSLFSDKMSGELVAEDVSLAMIGLKLVREENAHKRDNLVDIAGYAGLIELMKE